MLNGAVNNNELGITNSGVKMMATDLLRPSRGGFLRAFGCGEFIRQFLEGSGPYESQKIDPAIGAPQADIFYEYKMALIRQTALDRATGKEEKQAQKEERRINPDNIQELADRYARRMSYKSHGCRYHSFVVYFAMLQTLGWVEFTGQQEPSTFQANYPQGQPRKYFRLTAKGLAVLPELWANPQRALGLR